MIIPNGKTEYDQIKQKSDYLDEVPQEKKTKNFRSIILLLIIVLILFIVFCFSIKIYNDIKTKFKNLLRQKDIELDNLKKQLNNINNEYQKGSELKQEQKRKNNETFTKLDKDYLYDNNFYKKHNMNSETNLNTLGYESIIHAHFLEKEMEHFELSPFNAKNIRYLFRIIKNESTFENYKDKFSFIYGINSLREYKKIYENNGWKDKEEYKKVDDFLKNYTEVEQQKVGGYILTKRELEKDYKIDYLKFIKSRHSTRNYKNEVIKLDDVKKAVEMAKYSASVSNRQFIKLHFYPSGKMRENAIHYARKGGLYLEGVNPFIITFDANGLLGSGERNQGYFNAGIFSTNLVNAFHSLGIGTCFIQFSNSIKEEEELKKINEIPENERIAVILFAGYYDEKSIFAVSSRKNIFELLFEHK